jgi:hypothetical protein
MPLDLPGVFSPSAFEIMINVDTVLHVRVSTTLLGPDEQVIDESGPIDIDVDRASESVLNRGAVVAGIGDLVTIDNPHELELAPGLYEQRIGMTVFDESLDSDFLDIHARFIEVTESGLHRLSSAEYGELTQPLVYEVDRDGNPIVTIAGQLGAAVPRNEIIVEPRLDQRSFMIESGDATIQEQIKLPTFDRSSLENNGEDGGTP